MRLLPPINKAQSAVFIPETAKTVIDDNLANDLDNSPNSDLNNSSDNEIKFHSEKSSSAQTNIESTQYPILNGSPLSKAQTQALAEEINAVYKGVMDSLNENDARYIKRVYATVVYSELASRGLLALAGRVSSKRVKVATWLLGTSLLSFSKILNNMELGHNVMHGQYDWMQHPHLNSQKFDWDIMCPAPLWQHSHNYMHHTFTNIVDRDHDVGYHLIRVTDEQAWIPSDRFNPFKTLILALGFEWAVAFHDIQISVEEYADTPDMRSLLQQKSRDLLAKIVRQVGKDYIALPAIAGVALGRSSAMTTLIGNIAANIVRNVWTWAVIFCGHLTEQAHIYTHLDDNETKGDWYVRQILGSSNIKGSKLFHILTGNLSHQIEHHIFPDMPAHRYASVAPQVKEICRKYGIAYNTGNFGVQFKEVLQRIYHFSKPNAEELVAYQQAKMMADSDTAINAFDKVKRQQRVTKKVSGLKRFIPEVVRHTLFYAR